MGAAEKKAAKRSHKYSLDILEREQKYATDMWNKNNSYNSPEQVKQRYLNAGMNPYVMMSPGSVATSSMPSTPSVSPAVEQPSQWSQRVMGSLSSVQESIQTYLGAVRQNEENHILRNDRYKSNIDMQLYSAKALHELQGLKHDVKNKEYHNIIDGVSAYIASQNKDFRVQSERDAAQSAKSQAIIDGYTALQMSSKSKYFDDMAVLEYMQAYQSLYNSIEQGKLTVEQVKKEMANVRIFRADAAVKEGTIQYLIDKCRYEMEAAKNNRYSKDALSTLKNVLDYLVNVQKDNPQFLDRYRMRGDSILGEPLNARKIYFNSSPIKP